MQMHIQWVRRFNSGLPNSKIATANKERKCSCGETNKTFGSFLEWSLQVDERENTFALKTRPKQNAAR